MKKNLRIAVMFTCLFTLPWASGCGEDESKAPSGSSKGGKSAGGKGGATKGGASSTEEGGTGPSEGGTSATIIEGGAVGLAGTGNGGVAGAVNVAGTSSGGAPEPACNIYDAARPVQAIPADAEGNLVPTVGTTFTLTSDKTWTLTGKVYVPAGVTLKIEPCTLIVGSAKPNAGSLFITRGAKIAADGTANRPIVFSSVNNKFNSASPWGGVVLLGKAPIGASSDDGGTPERLFEGLTDPRVTYGGADPADNSGSMSYVRIEYGGDVIVANKEVNGLTLGGVGSGTSIHHIMVKRTLDDCFEWFGGTVNAHHLICENPGDDMFDTDERYVGSMQFLFGRLNVYGTSSDPNGFEWDGNQPNTTVAKRSIPKAANVTLCGYNKEGSAVAYGAVLRRGLQAGTTIQNAIITGFDNGVDTRDDVGTSAAPTISWTTSLFFGQLLNNVAAATETTDNDKGFDEVAWIGAAASLNGTTAPAGFNCYTATPSPFPTAAVAGSDTTANPAFSAAPYVGAFKDVTDNWMTGAWVDWASGD